MLFKISARPMATELKDNRTGITAYLYFTVLTTLIFIMRCGVVILKVKVCIIDAIFTTCKDAKMIKKGRGKIIPTVQPCILSPMPVTAKKALGISKTLH